MNSNKHINKTNHIELNNERIKPEQIYRFVLLIFLNKKRTKFIYLWTTLTKQQSLMNFGIYTNVIVGGFTERRQLPLPFNFHLQKNSNKMQAKTNASPTGYNLLL